MSDEPSTGTRIKRFIVLIALLAFVVAVAVIAINISRLSQDSIALGAGVAIGCTAGLIPVGLIVGSLRFVVRYLEEHEMRRSAHNQTYPNYGQPPVIVVPTGYPQMQQQQPWDPRYDAQIVSGPRQFTVIGED